MKPKPAKHKQSLAAQIEQPEQYGIRTVPRGKKRKGGSDDLEVSRKSMKEAPADGDAEPQQALPAKLSQRILAEARAQQAEGDEAEPADALIATLQAVDLKGGLGGVADDEEYEDEVGSEDEFINMGELDGRDELDEGEEQALQAFLAPKRDDKLPTLADLIMQKLEERKMQQAGVGVADDTPPAMNEQAVAVYREIGEYLTRYTTGKIPKAFKIIPKLKLWDEVLFLTSPQTWSPQATFYATKLFVANMNEKLAQRYLSLVLLPKSREYIAEHKKLHPEIFRALKKAAFKPGAFYRGIILPLCKSGSCTVREAVVFSSVLSRVSIPSDHSAAALKCLADMPYSGTTSFFIRTIIDKQYKLPLSVIGDIVEHFMRFEQEERQLPVVWHQSMLTFVQRYKQWLTPHDRERLKRLCRRQSHYQVTPEVHRELEHAAAQEKGQGHGQGVVVGVGKGAKAPGSGEDINHMAPIVLG